MVDTVKKAPDVEKEEPKSERQLEVEALRRNRIPAGKPGMNLDFAVREGYERRIVSDKPGRLEKFYKGGWRFVKADDVEPEDKNVAGLLKASTRQGIDGTVSQVIGSHKDRSPMMGYLMEIPTELYQEDRESEMEKVDALEDGLLQGMTPGATEKPGTRHRPSPDGQYVPDAVGIKIEQKGGQHRRS